MRVLSRSYRKVTAGLPATTFWPSYRDLENREIVNVYRVFLRGAEGQNRTGDTVIFSHVLYQLSYLGTAGSVEAKPTKSYHATRGRCGGPGKTRSAHAPGARAETRETETLLAEQRNQFAVALTVRARSARGFS